MRSRCGILPLRLRELADVPLILPGPRHWIRRLLARAAFQRGIRLNAALQADSVAMTKDMVRNGLGCTILPGIAVRDEIARGALVFRPIEQPALADHACDCGPAHGGAGGSRHRPGDGRRHSFPGGNRNLGGRAARQVAGAANLPRASAGRAAGNLAATAAGAGARQPRIRGRRLTGGIGSDVPLLRQSNLAE